MRYSSVLRLSRTALLAVGLTLLMLCAPAALRETTPTSGRALAAARVTSVARAASDAPGLTPATLRSAYSLPARAAKHTTVAVVVAYHDPFTEADLTAYSRRFHLPACTARNHCLRVLNEAGQTAPLPLPDQTGGNWNVEHALSTQVVHAICQNCSLLVVEASTDSEYDISTAVHAAAQAKARLIVTTYTAAQTYSDSQYASDFSVPGALVIAASGDSGYSGGVNFPSVLPGVLAVGGTVLQLDSRGRYRGERAWQSSTSGCGSYTDAAAWQRTQARSVGCGSHRALVDVSAVADPGVNIRITGADGPGSDWYEVGGTSLSAPVIAGVFALAGNGGARALSQLYRAAHVHPSALHDVRSGTNASSCHGRRICTALRGYDGPTGLGTPNGLAAFRP